MQAECIAAAEKDGDAIDMEGFAEAFGDGADEWSDFGEVAGLVRELGEKLLGGVGLAEEALIDLLLETRGEPESEDEEDDDDA